ncbi:MAG: hypothetical protein HKP56_17945 [Anderseniella sp.]|nr:hypothetical protein [Anderseniella sp.]
MGCRPRVCSYVNTILSAKCSNCDFTSYLWPKLALTVESVPARISGPLLSDWRNFESWRDDGSKTVTERANDIWKQLLRDYEQPVLDPAIDEELRAYISRRKEESARTGNRG